MILSPHADSRHAWQLLSSEPQGVGYLLKDPGGRRGRVRRVARTYPRGGTVVDRALVDQLLASRRATEPLAELTARERKVLALMAEGGTDRGIAMALYLSQKTVEAHVSSGLRKPNLPTDATENRRVHAVLRFIAAADSLGQDTGIPSPSASASWAR